MSYNKRLVNSISANGIKYQINSDSSANPLKLDTFYHLCMLVHDIRKRILEFDWNATDFENILVHSLKRTKHIVRYSLELFGIFDPSAGSFNTVFPSIDYSIMKEIDSTRSQWKHVKHDKNKIKEIFENDINFVETLFDEVMRKINVI